MCELILFVRDKYTRNKGVDDYNHYRRGDVVVVVPDGWRWGKGEISNNYWRVIQMPGLSEMAFLDWVEPMFIRGRAVLTRKFFINLDAIPDADWLNAELSVCGVGSILRLNEHESANFMRLKTLRHSPIPELVYGHVGNA